MIRSPKTVLVVDDEHAVRQLMRQGLPPHLPGFEVATAANGQEAIDYLTAHPVEVVVTDIAMPVKDGFELLAYVRNNHPNLPVVVLTVAAAQRVIDDAPPLGALRVLQKPASPAKVAQHVLGARSETARGRLTGVPLAPLLELMQLERKTCSLLVRSGERRGRLHFLSGELVNAYAFELNREGEAAARYLLALDEVTIDFERSLHNHVRRIHTPLATLMLDVARALDERRHDLEVATDPAGDRAEGTPDVGVAHAPHGAPAIAPSLEDAAAHLHLALAGLRSRTDDTTRALGEAAPGLADCVQVLAAAAPASTLDDERRFTSAWGEVSELARRLARAADALGTPADPRGA